MGIVDPLSFVGTVSSHDGRRNRTLLYAIEDIENAASRGYRRRSRRRTKSRSRSARCRGGRRPNFWRARVVGRTLGGRHRDNSLCCGKCWKSQALDGKCAWKTSKHVVSHGLDTGHPRPSGACRATNRNLKIGNLRHQDTQERRRRIGTYLKTRLQRNVDVTRSFVEQA